MEGKCQVCGLEGDISAVVGETEGQCAACHAELSKLDGAEPPKDEQLNPESQRTLETHALFDTGPVFERPDGSNAAASSEESRDEPLYDQLEHDDWMGDLRQLAAQSTAMNTNSRLDGSPAMDAPKNGVLMIQASSVFPPAGPFEVPAAAAMVPEVTPAVVLPGASGRSYIRIFGLLGVLAAVVGMAVFAIRTTVSRPVILRNQLGQISQGPAMARSTETAPDEGSAGEARRALPSQQQATAMPTPLGAPASASTAPRGQGAERNSSADPDTVPKAKVDHPPAADAVSSPPARSPQSLADAMQRAAGAKPAAPAATAETESPPEPQGFNRAAAMASLRGISGSLSSCKSDSRGSGKGTIRVTFAPSGNATNAVVEGGPFAGTPTGSCVARRFRGARVPPFSGGPMTVRQGFTIR